MSDTYSRNYILRHASQLSVVFEKRPKKYMFGCHNYGDIPGYINEADGDPWDVFAPGFEFRELKIGSKYKIKKVIGYYKLKNGNDKIAIRVFCPEYNEDNAKKEIKRFCALYSKRVKVPGKWVSLDENFDEL